jgi:hypothetical protein
MKLALCVCLGFTAIAIAQDRGIINDPDGYVNVRSKPSLDAPVVATVKNNQAFEFESEKDGAEWFRVKLAGGQTGFMHGSRIRFFYEEKDLPAKHDPNDELGLYGQAHGFVYAHVARGAAKGDPEAMKKYFAITDTDGAAAEEHGSVSPRLFTCWETAGSQPSSRNSHSIINSRHERNSPTTIQRILSIRLNTCGGTFRRRARFSSGAR